MNLFVGNHNPYPVCLKKGAVLVSLEQVELVAEDELSEDTSPEDGLLENEPPGDHSNIRWW